MKELKFVDWFVLLLSMFFLAIPVVSPRAYFLNVICIVSAINLLSTFIKNKIIRIIVGVVCIVLISYAYYLAKVR